MTAQPRHFLKEWRAHLSLTQGEVAERIGYERSYYSRIENNKRGYDQEILERLSGIYGCQPAELIGRNPAATAPLWLLVQSLSSDDLVRLTGIAQTLQGLTEAQ